MIEIHALQNFAPSNLNRDDTGAPKDAFFGGTRRARVSSQCSKRAVRTFFKEKKEAGFFNPEDLAIRTKRLCQEVANRLQGRRDEKEVLAKMEIALSYVDLKLAKDGKSQYLLFLGEKEISSLAEKIDQHWKEIIPALKDDEEKPSVKSKAKKDSSASVPDIIKKDIGSVFDGGKAVDLALFGRMLADMPKKNQDAACQVAHAISTHSVEREFDFFTAVDDLKPNDTAGADMIGTVEFNSACFYRYAVVDWKKFVEYLQTDVELGDKGLRAFLEGFVIAEPTGKQNTFAAHNPPEFVAVAVRHNTAPRNLANAFETPVNVKKDLSATSAEKLVEKAKALQSAYGGEEQTFVLNMTGAKLNGFGVQVSSLQELIDKVLAAVRQG